MLAVLIMLGICAVILGAGVLLKTYLKGYRTKLVGAFGFLASVLGFQKVCLG